LTTEENAYFSLLKQSVSQKLQEEFPSVNSNIEFWKGQEITYFQEDLQKRCKSSISEKWFYTHLKGKNEKLPRIDMLNLLSDYAGYKDWSTFIASQAEKNNDSNSEKSSNTVVFARKKTFVYSILAVVALFLGAGLYFLTHKDSYTFSFCFIDADMKTEITKPLEIVVFHEHESSRSFITDSVPCFSMRTPYPKITFYVKSPYYKSDTITRICNEATNEETISLETNDFALMVQYFAMSGEKDWRQNRNKLDAIFQDDARIYQIHGKNKLGVELFTKEEFIRKLTLPTRSLKDIKIIETSLVNDKISVLRFTQETDGMQ